MDMVHTFTAYLVLVTCIAAISTAKGLAKNGTIERDGKTIHHMNVTILSETKFAELCSSLMSKLEQCLSDSQRACNMSNDCYEAKYKFSLTLKNDRQQTCEIDRINTVFTDSQRTCNIANDCYKAKYKVNLRLKKDDDDDDDDDEDDDDDYIGDFTSVSGVADFTLKLKNGKTPMKCVKGRINTVFTYENGIQLNGICTGRVSVQSPCCCTLPETCICRNCTKSFRCDCTVETKKCTTTSSPVLNVTTISTTTTSVTTTRATTTRNTAPDKTTSVTRSLTPTMTPSSGSASGTATSGTTIDNTATSTPSGTTLPGSASSKTKFDGQDPRQMEVLVGGVVGGLFGGVVITVVILFLCRACRSRRRHTEDEDGGGTNESHTYLGLIHTTSSSGKSPPGTNAVTSPVPDLIRVSAVQQASSAPSDVYDVIKEGDDNQLGVDPSSCDQGDYVDITDDMTGAAVYSLAQAAPGVAVQDGTLQPAAEYFVLEKDDPTDGDYNKLVRDGATETGTDAQGTYNRLVKDGATETTTDVQGTYNSLVREGATETTTDVQGTYNRLVKEGATETTTDVQSTYNKLGSMVDDNDDNEPGRNNVTTVDYFVLEKPEDTSNKLAQAAPGVAVQDDIPPSAAEYFVLEKDDPTDGDYNRLVRGDATETTTDVQDTYNKLGSMADDNEVNEPGGNNGTAADYFVLEKPEDTYNQLEGKRSAEEEQQP